MKLLVLTSCTGEKAVDDPRQLTMADFKLGPNHVSRRERELSNLLRPAAQLYTGQQHVRLMRGVERHRNTFDIDLWVLSAGYGLVPGDRKLAPYEATFAGMKKAVLRHWADQLGVPAAIRELLTQQYDLALLLLGDSYLEACALDEKVKLGGPALLFAAGGALKKLPRLAGLRRVPVSNNEASRFSCGLVALKGELAARLLDRIATDPGLPHRLRDPAVDLIELLDAEVASAASSNRAAARPNPAVDYVVSIPRPWWDKPHRKKLRYFIPEWDDLVDPQYNFETDTHAGGSGDWSNEVYAHQLYPEPNYDGILISKVVAEKSKKKKARINALGAHRFLRVPRQFPVMGDCGAFGYIFEKVPPYSTGEILDYYTRLDFDFGVSIDHLIVTATEAEKRERYELTIQNAEEFLHEHRRQGLAWTPVGAVQGWDPSSYANAARQYVSMGYRYIGLGGLVRTSTPDILRILEAVHQVVPPNVAIHCFGLSRIGSLRTFSDLGVRSVDSASVLRQAWMGGGRNYLTADGVWYPAIRIPESNRSFRAKRMVSDGRASPERARALERKCMNSLLQFDRGLATVDDIVDVIAEYDALVTPDRPEARPYIRRTLEAAPWRQCPCSLCRAEGIEMIIFRGNNRNRRRGFHNVYQFYRMVQRALAGEAFVFSTAVTMEALVELPLFSQAPQ